MCVLNTSPNLEVPSSRGLNALLRRYETVSNVMRGNGAFVGVTGLGWDVVGVQNLAQTGGKGYACWHCGLHHVRLQHVALVHAHAKRCRSYVCGIDQDGGANKALDKVGGILHARVQRSPG